MEVQRIQFEVPIERLQELEKLMTQAGIVTKKELLNNALTLLEWVVGEKARGHAIASVDRSEKRFKELAMPIFSNIKPEQTLAPAASKV